MFAGHIGDQTVIAGVGLGVMFSNIFVKAIIIGLNTTLTTLIS